MRMATLTSGLVESGGSADSMRSMRSRVRKIAGELRTGLSVSTGPWWAPSTHDQGALPCVVAPRNLLLRQGARLAPHENAQGDWAAEELRSGRRRVCGPRWAHRSINTRRGRPGDVVHLPRPTPGTITEPSASGLPQAGGKRDGGYRVMDNMIGCRRTSQRPGPPCTFSGSPRRFRSIMKVFPLWIERKLGCEEVVSKASTYNSTDQLRVTTAARLVAQIKYDPCLCALCDYATRSNLLASRPRYVRLISTLAASPAPRYRAYRRMERCWPAMPRNPVTAGRASTRCWKDHFGRTAGMAVLRAGWIDHRH